LTKTLLETESYYQFLYSQMLEEIEYRDPTYNLTFPKWLKDVLLVLLCKAKPNVKRKWLRRKISLDLKKITDRTLKELRVG